MPLPFPSDDKVWARPSFHRKFYDDEPDCDVEGESHEPLLLRHSWDLQQLEGYLRTWSAAHTFNEEHGGDVVGRFLESLSSESIVRISVSTIDDARNRGACPSTRGEDRGRLEGRIDDG